LFSKVEPVKKIWIVTVRDEQETNSNNTIHRHG